MRVESLSGRVPRRREEGPTRGESGGRGEVERLVAGLFALDRATTARLRAILFDYAHEVTSGWRGPGGRALSC